MSVTTKRVDYENPQDCADLVRLLDEYVRLESGGTPDLDGITDQLAAFPTAFSVLAYDDVAEPRAIGLINCFFGFSTFMRRPLVNIHDVIVTENQRGNGIAALMLDEVCRIAKRHDCCRLTLEVYASNASARRAYDKYGFTRDPAYPDVDVHFLRKTL